MNAAKMRATEKVELLMRAVDACLDAMEDAAKREARLKPDAYGLTPLTQRERLKFVREIFTRCGGEL